MAHEEIVLHLMKNLKIADKHIVGDIMASKGLWTAGTSSTNNSYKALTTLTELGKLVKGDRYFKTLDCKSEFKEHAQLITKALAEVLKPPLNSIIHREITTPVGLRPDAICLITKDNQGYCFILEVCNTETELYLEQKVNTWNNWDKSLEFLSQLFGYKIPHFDIVPVTVLDGFISYLKEVV